PVHRCTGHGHGHVSCVSHGGQGRGQSRATVTPAEGVQDLRRGAGDVPWGVGKPRTGLLREAVREPEDGLLQLRAVREAVPVRGDVLRRRVRQRVLRPQQLRLLRQPVQTRWVLQIRDVRLRVVEEGSPPAVRVFLSRA
ncbi:Stigma-specific protein, Stig1, partial [Musa troglodytarum]